MFSLNFCGSKAAEYFGLVSNSICIVLPGIDLVETLEANEQFLRRALTKLSSRKAERVSLVFLINSSESAGQATAQRVTQFVQNIWSDVDGQVGCI